MHRCPICADSLHDARVVCAGCGEALPLRVIVISEGSQGGGFALVKEVDEGENADERGLLNSMQEEANEQS